MIKTLLTQSVYNKNKALALFLVISFSAFTCKMKAQYCTTSYATGTSAGDYISLVEFVGTTLNNPSGAAASPFYTFFPNTGATTTTLNIGTPYILNVTGGTYSVCYISMWGDWNQDGIFSSSEYMGTSPNVGSMVTASFSGNIMIPYNALAGTTRIRLRSSDTSPGPGSSDACNATNSNYGETEDYEITVLPLPPCTGAPIAGNAISTSTLVCDNTSFYLDLSGNTFSSGITYQWQSSPNGTTWTNLGSIQNSWVYSVGNFTANTFYRCINTCTASSQSDISSIISVTLKPLIDCYCTPALSNYVPNCSQDKISEFSIANVVSQTTNCDLNGFSDSTISNYTTINLSAGNIYTLSATSLLSGFNGDGIMGAWIDYNQNSIFENNEFTSLGFGPAGTYSSIVNVPFTAIGGSVRMRLVLDAYYAYAGTILNPCSGLSGYPGQIIDYKVNITAAPACSLTPNAGIAISTLTNVCNNTPYILDLAGNDAVSGINYQWQTSPNGTSWVNLGVPQNTVPFAISSQSGTTYYRCIATCLGSSLSGTSTAVMVTQKLPTACYCVPQAINCSSSYFTNVVIETLNDNPVCITGGYIDNSGVMSPVALNVSQNYTISTNIFCQNGTGYVGVWIDFNQDGIFDSYEYNDIGSITTGSLTGNIYVPFTALAGYTKMRLKMESTYGTFQGFNPCTSGEYDGETIDYDVFITLGPLCSGTPNAGDADAPSTTICENTPFDLNLLNNTIASNISYQWQSSLDNVIWTNIGAPQTTVPFYISTQTVTTHYRCVTTCTTSASSATSTPITILQNPLTACYCIPPAAFCANGDEINNVVFATLSNTSTCSVDGYENYSVSVPSTSVNAGQSYTLAVTVGSDYFGNVAVWIDYDQNGVFDATEYTNVGTTNSAGNYTVVNTINIPGSALMGNTKMRIRNNNQFPFQPNDACADGAMAGKSTLGGPGSGETEDYLLTILPPDCGTINFPSSVSASGPSAICPGQAAALDLATAMPFATGITYQWMSSNGGAFGNEGSLSNTSNISVTPSTTSYYYCDIMCNGSSVLKSDTISVSIDIVAVSVTGNPVSCFGACNGSASVTPTSGAGGNTYSWSTVPTSTTPFITSLCAGVYTVFVTDVIGCSATGTISITEPAAIISTPFQTNVSCYGLTDGIAAVSAIGGTSPFTYSWTPNVGTGSSVTNLGAGVYLVDIRDANNCLTSQAFTITQPAIFTASITGSSSSICEQLEDTLKSTIVGGVSPYLYSWKELPSNVVSTNANYDYTTSVGSFSYNLVVTDANNCSATSNTLNIVVNPSSNFSGMVTTNPSVPVAGRVVLYKYLPFFTKFDSVAGQTIAANGSFLFNSFTSGSYIIKAIPTATNLQITYGDSAVNWKTATLIQHGCAVNDVQNINVKALGTFTSTGTGSLSGKITAGPGYGQRMGSEFKPTGTPIGGIVVKGGKNPGGQMFVQTTTDPTTGTYTLAGLPDNTGIESYFILVDIPGLDTNGTYDQLIINISNTQYTNLDFIVDSAKINPVSAVSVHDISAKEHSIKIFPNPASNYVTIQYDLQNSSQVKIELFDILGKSVKKFLPSTMQNIGSYKTSWTLEDLNAGMYFIKMNINGTESTIKLSVSN